MSTAIDRRRHSIRRALIYYDDNNNVERPESVLNIYFPHIYIYIYSNASRRTFIRHDN